MCLKHRFQLLPALMSYPLLSSHSTLSLPFPSAVLYIIMYTQLPFFPTSVSKYIKSSPPQALTGIQSNGPGLHYKVMWRQKSVDSDWTSVTVSNTSKFVVSGTPTFVPYELKVQAVNDYGAGPEPAIAHGFSGEDCELEGFFTTFKLKNKNLLLPQ